MGRCCRVTHGMTSSEKFGIYISHGDENELHCSPAPKYSFPIDALRIALIASVGSFLFVS